MELYSWYCSVNALIYSHCLLKIRIELAGELVILLWVRHVYNLRSRGSGGGGGRLRVLHVGGGDLSVGVGPPVAVDHGGLVAETRFAFHLEMASDVAVTAGDVAFVVVALPGLVAISFGRLLTGRARVGRIRAAKTRHLFLNGLDFGFVVGLEVVQFGLEGLLSVPGVGVRFGVDWHHGQDRRLLGVDEGAFVLHGDVRGLFQGGRPLTGDLITNGRTQIADEEGKGQVVVNEFGATVGVELQLGSTLGHGGGHQLGDGLHGAGPRVVSNGGRSVEALEVVDSVDNSGAEGCDFFGVTLLQV